MPNAWQPPNNAILQSPIGFEYTNFVFMFGLDGQGKCRVRHNDSYFKCVSTDMRKDWLDRLRRLLKESGTAADYEAARRLFKIDL